MVFIMGYDESTISSKCYDALKMPQHEWKLISDAFFLDSAGEESLHSRLQCPNGDPRILDFAFEDDHIHIYLTHALYQGIQEEGYANSSRRVIEQRQITFDKDGYLKGYIHSHRLVIVTPDDFLESNINLEEINGFDDVQEIYHPRFLDEARKLVPEIRDILRLISDFRAKSS